jgi:hypothetical protein
MHPSDLVDTLDAGTTRRRVLTTGAKLAYAAPLVAATYKLSASRTFAADACTEGEDCANGVVVNCGANGFCACVANVDGGFACVDRACSGVACKTGADCDSGLCISAPGCCGDPNPFCGTPCTDVVSGAPGVTSTGWH